MPFATYEPMSRTAPKVPRTTCQQITAEAASRVKIVVQAGPNSQSGGCHEGFFKP